MTQNEIITIVISTGALAVSLVTLYLTYFYKRAALIAVLLQRGYNTEGTYDGEVEYSLSNTGNLQLILKEIELLIGNSMEGKSHSSYSIAKSETTDLPLIIEPGHVRLVRMRFKDEEIKEAKKDDMLCIVSFTLISSQGKIYEVLHDLTPFEEDHNSESARKMWKPFRLGKSSA